MDIIAEFELDKKALKEVYESNEEFSCSSNTGGAAQRGALGPFGLLVLADESRSEQTPIYFYVSKGPDGYLKTFFCTDQSRYLYISQTLIPDPRLKLKSTNILIGAY